MRISTGSQIFDDLLDGGLETDTITTVYGPAGSGKTNLAICSALSTVLNGKKVIYIDTEGNFSVARLSQLTENYSEVLNQMSFFKPVNFEEQKQAFKKLKTLVTRNVGLIIVDSISMLYRLEIGQNRDEVYSINRTLGLQISYLSEIARTKHIPILLTNQVYSNFEEKDAVKMVGGDILKYGSKCLIELKNLKNKHKAILHKHRSLPAEKEIEFKIVEKGLVSATI